MADQRRRAYWVWLFGGIAAAIVLWWYWPQERPANTSGDRYGFPAMQTVELKVGKKQMARLHARRDKALELGILQEDDSSWVKAELIEDDRNWPVRIRLKGDWVDHLEGDKWSFRVELKGEGAWRRMTEFSLQSPERRGNLDEWVFHQVLARENVLCPRYDFIYLVLNGEDLGTYAVEEHFAKELLESQGHREGPILRFDESGMWDARVAALRDSAFPYMQIPFQEAATVSPFKQKRTLADTILRQEFRIANQLMQQYRDGSGAPAELFDLGLVAKQYALVDLFQAYHSLIWHNRRFYYNPVTSKLEPVVFDAFTGQANDSYIQGPIWGYKTDGFHPTGDYHDVTGDFFFRDEGFVRAYYAALDRFSRPGFLDSILLNLQPQIVERERFLRLDASRYSLETQDWKANAIKIQALLLSGGDARQLAIVTEEIADFGTCQLVRNLGPLHLQVWVEGRFEETVQMLPPAVSGNENCIAVFNSASPSAIRCRIPRLSLPSPETER
jgi:hypothetical protein